VSRDDLIFVFVAISATADFLAILARAGLLNDANETGGPLPTKEGSWSLAIILFLCTLGLSVYGFERVRELESQLTMVSMLVLHQAQVIVGWGSTDPTTCTAELNGAALVEYIEKHNAVLICGITDPTVDKQEDHRITISTARTILMGNMVVSTPFSEIMGSAIQKLKDDALKKQIPKPQQSKNGCDSPMVNLWYEVAVLPKGTNPNDITRLSDVHRYGGKVLSIER
jgi:hypothetical protein